MISTHQRDRPVSDIVDLLDLEKIGEDCFRGYSPATAGKQVYGGQAVAQALVAATRTVETNRPVHSLHAYFILAGDPRRPIDFTVARLRDGKSFTTRRCDASQDGRIIFSLTASFQSQEDGLAHATPMPSVPDPESLDDANALIKRFQGFLPQPAKIWLERPCPLEMRIVSPQDVLLPEQPPKARKLIWFRMKESLPQDQALHRALIAYLSDMTLLNTALLAHGRTIFDPQLQVASVDHALWFHSDAWVDDWLLFAQESPISGQARALTRGQIFSRAGALVASVAQEGLIRLRDK